ncbi:MAG: Ditrans,polycis-undecaprenyl-diphosphate synthase ((2E,6E)-farnesyl-diphosphate specific) [Chlamydiae bacterium]|nr:Ditrans,polycis-undecaprenyl-diphosphate synthase ((2E,6E)-farnesyl-diphosphate specific) [Chlamydiota bacterium]
MEITYTEAELAPIQQNTVPHHVAIIMDGNRRWATKKNPLQGHWAGAAIVLDIDRAASNLGIKILTLYGFSTENWSRSEIEVAALEEIIEVFLRENRERMIEEGVRLHIIGDLTPFPESLKKEVARSLDATKECTIIELVVGLNYGGRDDIRRAFGKMVDAIGAGTLDKNNISESTIATFLDTAPYGDPDLLIRTSGEMRVSNFLLWQLAYTEIYVTGLLWPDFTSQALYQAVLSYQQRRRRIGS